MKNIDIFLSEVDAIFEVDCEMDRQDIISYFLDEFIPQFLETLELLLKSSRGMYLTGNEVLTLLRDS